MLVFLAMSALVTLVVGEFDLSVASMMGITATTIPVLAGIHGMNICPGLRHRASALRSWPAR